MKQKNVSRSVLVVISDICILCGEFQGLSKINDRLWFWSCNDLVVIRDSQFCTESHHAW